MYADHNRQTVIVGEELLIDSISDEVQTIDQPTGLLNHVSQNLQIDIFDIYVSGQYIDQISQCLSWQLAQVKRVTFFFDSIDEMERAKEKFGQISSKFLFCLKSEVVNRIQNNHLLNSISNYVECEKSLKSDIEARKRRLQRKQQNLEVHGFDVKNINSIDSRYRCAACSYLLRNPVQLYCGHRICQSCASEWEEYVFNKFLYYEFLFILFARDSIVCVECGYSTQKDEVIS